MPMHTYLGQLGIVQTMQQIICVLEMKAPVSKLRSEHQFLTARIHEMNTRKRDRQNSICKICGWEMRERNLIFIKGILD